MDMVCGIPNLAGVALSAGDSRQDRLKMGLTRCELLVVCWLAVEGLVDSPGKNVTTWGRDKENERLGPTSLN